MIIPKQGRGMYVWWPGIDKEIQECVRTCHDCQINKFAPPVAWMQTWKWPIRPWTRIHLDYVGPFLGRIDAHSKQIEAFCVISATSETLVTDNRTCFTNDDFEHEHEHVKRIGM